MNPEYLKGLVDSGQMTPEAGAAIMQQITGNASQAPAPLPPAEQIAADASASPSRLPAGAPGAPVASAAKIPAGAMPPSPGAAQEAGKAAGSLTTDSPVPQQAMQQPAMPSPMTALKGQSDAMLAQERSFDKEAKAGDEFGKNTFKAYDDLRKQTEADQAEEMIRRDEERQEREAQTQKLQQAQEDFKKSKPDPNRWFKNQSTAQHIGNAIAIFLGGFDPKGNKVLDFIQSQIDKDIKAQEDEIAVKKSAVDMESNALARLTQDIGDRRQARIAFRQLALDSIQAQLHAAEAKYKGTATGEAARRAGMMVEQQRQGLIQQQMQAMELQRAEKVVENQGQGAGSAEIDKALASLPAERRDKFRALRVRGSGFDGFASSPDRAKELQTMSNDIESAKSNLLELQKMSRSMMGAEEKAKAQVLRQTTIGQLRTALLGPGTINDSERKIMESVIADPTAIFQKNAKTSLSALQAILDKKLATAAKNEGIRVNKIDEQAPTK